MTESQIWSRIIAEYAALNSAPPVRHPTLAGETEMQAAASDARLDLETVVHAAIAKCLDEGACPALCNTVRRRVLLLFTKVIREHAQHVSN